MRLALSIVVAMATVALGCGGTRPSPPPAPQMRSRGQASQPSGTPSEGGVMSMPSHLTQLGITGHASPGGPGGPMGLLVTGFIESSEPWPLQTIGVETGDVIVGCNGEQQQLAVRIVTAMQNLQETGEPIALVVVRAGKQVTLERAEKFPESQAGQTAE